MEDEELISRYQQGQQIYLDVLIDRYKNNLYKFCRHLTNSQSEADDIFQETWLKVVEKLYLYKDTGSFISWLYTIAANIYKDQYRKKKRWLNIIKEYFSNESKEWEMNRQETQKDLPQESCIREEEKEEVRKALTQLHDLHRIPLILFYFQEMKYTEIAEILDIPEGTVKSRISQGKKKLRESMEVGKSG